VSFKRFFLVRLGWALIGLWLAVTVVFLVFLTVRLPREEFRNFREPGIAYRAYLEEHHFEDPIHERYALFVWDFLDDGSIGRSSETGQESRPAVLEALPATLALVFPGLALALAVAFGFSLAWARAGAKPSRLWRLPLYLAIGAMPIWVGLWLLASVGREWDAYLIGGYCDVFDPPKDVDCGGPFDWTTRLILPWLTFSLFFAAVYARILWRVVTRVRSADAEERRPVARRAGLGATRVIGRDIGFAIGAAVFVEVIFQIPGIGRMVVNAALNLDFTVMETALLYATFLAVAVHFLVDIVVGALDPDLRWERPVARRPKPA
jgi:peptide/nickel transport system permease protein